MATGIKVFNFDIGPIYVHAFNRDATQVAVASIDPTVYIYQRQGNGWTRIHELTDHSMRITGIDWAPKSNKIVTCSADKSAFVWTLSNGRWTSTLVLAKLNFAATCVKWSPNENKFAVGSSQKCVSICFFEENQNWWVSKHIKKDILSTVSCISWHPNNVILAVGSFDCRVRVFSTYMKDIDVKPDPNPWGRKMPFEELLATFQLDWYIKDVQFSPSGFKLAFITHGSTVSVVNAEADVNQVLTFYSTELPFKSLAWVTESTLVCAGFNLSPVQFTVTPRGVEKQLTYDTKSASRQGDFVAKKIFHDMDRYAATDLETTLSTIHQNPVTQVLPLKTDNNRVSEFSTVSLDHSLVIWPIEQAA